MLVELIYVFFFSFTTLFVMRKVAKRIGLVDKPNERKQHLGVVPLAGGISVCISVSYFLYQKAGGSPQLYILLISLMFLTLLGALDDKYDLSVKLRLALQTCVAVAMMHFTDYRLVSLGDPFGLGSIDLPLLGYGMTVFAVIAAINAFNMVDGIDGLLGGLSIVTFASLALLGVIFGDMLTTSTCLIFICAIIPYVCMNLGLLGRKRKVFMGDAGSMMIGFAVVWLLLSVSQVTAEVSQSIRPVTALWLIAIPLMDMAAIMIRRIKRGDSPFKPDREHLHHIFQKLGFTSTRTLVIIVLVSTSFALVGVLGEVFNIPEPLMFYSFVALFGLYHFALSNVYFLCGLFNSIFGTNLSIESAK
ncbi:UDP-N-acetylglucosamine--undecaprenyl-phosphate N-acetylglucosaminephosphotransferase [Pseudoalteromonas aurantia]|uniref:Undecaprenyl-phosphate alpha-N-acetylglucosaminyl 1-phosphate transferase n=1 Tax=Pseudoalteromonas aurantia 208 TaxID=1314867 RepID=A0ABR9EE34_9GAMM|nr:UDP-N-acetylglucosamine--undecaprenyl-phosphate N-acetylglucosaminephosphotransferase [Pseudoalteromonas aurantia]MBE0369248.1 UDP-GlcNAc:undecaprenyl-phosphate GlcNAc-1-phosphate transferase [Pseudoalteromonas aurantia 208]